MKYKLPPLSALRLFEASARLGSFKSAAEELGLTPSAVGHGIVGLEDWLGVPLFRRTTKGLVLSPAGARYLPAVRQSLEAITAASEDIAKRQQRDQLSISAAPTCAARWLLPRLHDFRRKHPAIKVSIDTSKCHANVLAGEADLAIRLGRGEWPGLVAELLLAEELVPVCSPQLADRLAKTDQLDQVRLIHVNSTTIDWEAWARLTGHPPISPEKGLKVDTLEMGFQAASQGIGVVLGRRPLVDPEIRSGRLVEIHARPIKSQTAYWLVFSQASENRSAVRQFRKWILEQVQQYPGADGGVLDLYADVAPRG